MCGDRNDEKAVSSGERGLPLQEHQDVGLLRLFDGRAVLFQHAKLSLRFGFLRRSGKRDDDARRRHEADARVEGERVREVDRVVCGVRNFIHILVIELPHADEESR